LAPVLLFDGDCGLCSRAVQFVARRDRDGHFRYAALGSPVGRALAGGERAEGAGDTLILVVGGSVLLRSDAVAAALLRLPGWRWVGKVLGAIPRPLRDLGYRGVARVRRRIFPPPNVCVLPDPALHARVLPP
jgi:predicted DCC family thiol-disulfide oxidoreductase YuxK